jgi:hypothetical protein
MASALPCGVAVATIIDRTDCRAGHFRTDLRLDALLWVWLAFILRDSPPLLKRNYSFIWVWLQQELARFLRRT